MVFSIPTFATIGDEYDKKKVVDERSKGKSFVAVAPKKGHMPDALFQKTFLSIHEGDKYVDPGVAEKRYRLEKAKKNLVPQGFRYSNPSPKACGLGSNYGTLQKEGWPHETDYIVPRKGESPPRREPAKRPIFTNPSKKGTYGFPNTTLSNIGQDYVADFYDAMRERERRENQLHHQKLKGAGFRCASRRGFTFDEALGTGVSGCYRMTKPMAKLNRKPKEAPKKVETPWRPSGPIEKGPPKLEYREDPFDGYDPRVGKKKKVLNGDKASFRPAGATNTSWFTSSIAFKRL